MRRKKEEAKPFDGGFDVKAMVDALSMIEDERSITQEETLEILRQSFEKAYRDWSDPINSDDLLAEAVLDLEDGRIHIFDVKNVVEEVEDDLIEIELAEAREIDPSIEVGAKLKTEVDLTKISDVQPLIRKIANNFKQKMIEANKAALLEKFNSQIGHLISGEVEKVDHGFVILSFGKTTAYLSAKNCVPNEKFTLGEMVKVYLEGVGEKAKNPQLLITRANDKFLMKLFEEEVHDVYDGTVVIKKISREPGVRSKVAVYSTNPNVDPTGACIGPDGNRIRSICAQLSGEKIDVIRYIENPALFIVEALKPASVVGVKLNDDDSRTAIAVVKNGESKVAIGKRGVNVRLASRLVGYSIDVRELDEAMGQKISYRTIDDIRREEALAHLSEAETADQDIVIDSFGEEPEEEDYGVTVPAPEPERPAVEEETPAPSVAAPSKSAEPVVEERIVIKAKPKVTLAELEAQIEEEKKRKGKETPSPKRKYQKPRPQPKPEEEEEPVQKTFVEPAVPTMPIYTEEELKALEEEENNGEGETDIYDDYDDDAFYGDDDSGKDSWHF